MRSLRPMFTGIVQTYDSLNHLLTFGLDRAWRDAAAKECITDGLILDLCCGTADLGLSILQYAAPRTLILGLDFTKEMLIKAVTKMVSAKGKNPNASKMVFVLADAEHMPLKDGCVSRVGISFSFRNLVYKNPKATGTLKESLRVLNHDGLFVCIETSQPPSRLIKSLYHLYLMRIVPFLGGLLSRRVNAYRYFAESSVNFHPANEVSRILLAVGFKYASFRRMTFGVAAIHIAGK